MTYKTFGFSEDQVMIRDNVLKLLTRVMPDEKIDECERNDLYPLDAFKALAAAGYLALPIEGAYGGANASHKDLAVFVEATAYHHPGVTTAFMTTVIYGGMYIQYHGTKEQKDFFLPKIISGDARMAVAYTEPQSGSDAAGIQTKAARDGEDYVINGQKVYITNAHEADYLVITAKTNPDGGHKGISLFIVDTTDPSVTIRPMNSLGRRTSLPNEVFLDDVRVPRNRMLGAENEGWKKLMTGLNLERVLLAAASSGQCMKIIQISKEWALNRYTFGKQITDNQAISHKFSEMQMLMESSRLHTYSAAEMLDAGLNPVMETSMAKVVATENNYQVADMALQIMGGFGYMDGPISRLYRDSRVGPIGGGSSEIMRNVIAKQMGL